jgi:hypothetical protein
MHIHGSQTKLITVNPYSAAAERAIAAQRPTRRARGRKVIKSAKNIECLPLPDEASLLANWMDAGGGDALAVQMLSSAAYNPAVAVKDSSFA